MKKSLLCFLSTAVLLCLINIESSAQNQKRKFPGKIAGSVVDSATGNPIGYATLTLLARDTILVTGTISKDDGTFLIENVPFGEFTLKCHFLGYDNYFKKGVRITPGSTMFIAGVLKVSASPIKTGDVVVEADKDIVSYQIDKKVINLSQSESAKGQTTIEALENVPSIRVDIEGNIYLRGNQNFTLLVDGRPTVIAAKDLLRQLPAEAVDRIEIITNPSAKYDPDGVAGIINLIMVKEEFSGLSGIVNTSAGSRDKYTGSFNVNYKNSNYNSFIGMDASSRRMFPTSDFISETWTGDSVFFSRSDLDRLYFSKGYNIKGGSDFYVSDKQTLSVNADYGYFGFDRDFPTHYSLWNSFNEEQAFTISKDFFKVDGDYFAGFTNYDWNIDDAGQKIATNFHYSFWQADVNQNSSNIETINNFSEENNILRQNNSQNTADGTRMRYKIDYELPVSESSKLEAGFLSEYFIKNSEYIYNDYDTSSASWILNTLYSNDSKYKHLINSVYATYSNKIFGFSVMLGLRAENFNRELEQITEGKLYDLQQFNLFPTLHLSYPVAQGSQIQVSYSRRVYRPDHRQLNPYPDFIDDHYISKGNPNLKPQFTDSYELNYRTSFAGIFVSAETYYRRTDDIISRVLRLQPDGKILITSMNQNKDFLYGGELSINTNPLPWLRFYTAANYYNYNFVEKRSGIDIERNKNVFDMNTVLTFIFSRETVVQLTGYYQGPRIVADGEVDDYFVTSATFRQDFFDRKLTLTLSARDLFSTAKYEFTSETINLRAYGEVRQESPVLILSFSYKINNYEQQKTEDDTPDTNFRGGI